jgi:FMN phosphatase YigB (HAD superfamily)
VDLHSDSNDTINSNTDDVIMIMGNDEIRNYLFDVDDTLLDFGISEKNALHEAFLEFGLPTGAEDYARCYQEISKVLWRDLEQGHIDLTILGVERFKRLFLKHGLDMDADEFSRAYLGHLGKVPNARCCRGLREAEDAGYYYNKWFRVRQQESGVSLLIP